MRNVTMNFSDFRSLIDALDDDPDLRTIARVRQLMPPEEKDRMMALLRLLFPPEFAKAENEPEEG